MLRDPIVEEVREVRRRTEEACGHDWKRLTEHYRNVQPVTGRLIRREPRRLPTPSVNDAPRRGGT